MTRKKIPDAVQAEVLTLSRRRCCICYGLNKDRKEKKGQIAHLDQDNTNSSLENLAFLCLDHHDQYDSRTSVTKNFTANEVIKYREELYRINSDSKQKESAAKSKLSEHVSTDYEPDFKNKLRQEWKEIIVEKIENAGILRGVGNIHADLGITWHTAKRLLFELTEENILRADRQKGSSRKTYTLTNSIENRLIDSFVRTIQEEIVWENRYTRLRPGWEIDALIETKKKNYLIETIIPNEDKLDSA